MAALGQGEERGSVRGYSPYTAICCISLLCFFRLNIQCTRTPFGLGAALFEEWVDAALLTTTTTTTSRRPSILHPYPPWR
eukprot:2700067-Rhodomonas_salina.2